MKDQQRKHILFHCIVFVFCMLIFGCKSNAVRQDAFTNVNPLALLGEDSDIYLFLPVQYHQELTVNVLETFVPGLTGKDALSIAERISDVYAGLSLKNASTLTVELAASGDFPPLGINAVMKEKNGWRKETYSARSSRNSAGADVSRDFTVYKRSGLPFKLSFPSAKTLVLSKNVNKLLERYAVAPAVSHTAPNQWLQQEGQTIQFYVAKPDTYLRLISKVVSIDCSALYGSVSYKPNTKYPSVYSGEYALSFFMQMPNRYTMPVAHSLLSLTFGALGATVSQTDENTLYVQNLPVTDLQLIDFFTGKALK